MFQLLKKNKKKQVKDISLSDSNSLYDVFKTELVGTDLLFETFLVNGLKVPVVNKVRAIGVNLSGGADSACLAFLLCDYIQKKGLKCDVHIITHLRWWKTRPWQDSIALQVYNYLVGHYPSISFFRHVNYIPPEIERSRLGDICGSRSGDEIAVHSFSNYIAYQYNLGAVYDATTRNPPGVGLDSAPKNRALFLKDLHINRLAAVKQKVFYFSPFRYICKNWVMEQYYFFNKLDLLGLTRSCEGDLEVFSKMNLNPFNLEDYTSGMSLPVCGRCFWCLERSWALENMDKSYCR